MNETTCVRLSEWQAWDQRRAALCAEHAGRWVVLRGEEVTGVWETYEAALAAGYEAHGLEPFLVQFVAEVDPVVWFLL
jgi:hypothetical protein